MIRKLRLLAPIASLLSLVVLAAACGGATANQRHSADDDASPDDDDDNSPHCGDGVCSPGENCLNCPQDCECACGDGVCAFGEFCANCPQDCDCRTLAATPPMGWNSWNIFSCNIDETTIKQVADALVASDMRDAGYVYVNMDDCWQTARAEDGTIIADPDRFPSGIAALAEYVHNLGLKFGLYTCAGTETCQGRPGSYNHEYQDAQTYADWGVDYVKVDWCNTKGLVAHERYAIFHDAIQAAGGAIALSICDWGEDIPAVWGPRTGQLWRTTGDISDKWLSMWWNMIQSQPYAPFAGPGAWNDPDMLEVGNGGMTDDEYRTHLSLWAMMAAPLIAGNDLRSMDAATAEILTNAEVIAVDQDPSGVAGRRLTALGELEVWARPLTLDGARAVLLFNNQVTPQKATVSWSEIGLADGSAAVRDLWAHADLGSFVDRFSADLAPFASRMLLVKGAEFAPPAGEHELSGLPWKHAAGYLWNVARNQSAGGQPLAIAGVKYRDGLGVAAASQILYHLGGRCSSFTAEIGVDDETHGAGSAVFEVWADGRRLSESPVLYGGGAAVGVRVDLTGRRELKLVVNPGGYGAFANHADWAKARLICR